MQFDADGLPVDGPSRPPPRSASAASGLSSGGGSLAAGAGGDVEAENRLLRSRLQAVESVSCWAA